jgi:diguanylate cyclase (GGDEF)-like protein
MRVRHGRNVAVAAWQFATTHDPLTKLPNRELFVSRLDAALTSGGTGAVLILDIDRLPQINDALGHDAGDGVLIDVADRLRSSVRADDLVARMSGGEFVVLLQMDPEADVLAIAERLIERIRISRATPTGELSVPAKVGMVQWNADTPAMSGGELIRGAERAMHEATPARSHPMRAAG